MLGREFGNAFKIGNNYKTWQEKLTSPYRHGSLKL
jgi:hypothetical protein